MDWEQTQKSLWLKWTLSNPKLKSHELWIKYKHEWIEAYRPFVKKRNKPYWLL